MNLNVRMREQKNGSEDILLHKIWKKHLGVIGVLFERCQVHTE